MRQSSRITAGNVEQEIESRRIIESIGRFVKTSTSEGGAVGSTGSRIEAGRRGYAEIDEGMNK